MILGTFSLAPKEGQTYSCLNCQRFDFERDGCFTEWMEGYGFRQQEERCPGYNPPENGEYISVLSGSIELEDLID
ncbi:MAG: hypothetical protein ABIH37_00945 [archaeon]